MIFTDPPYGVSYTDKNEFLYRIGKPLACVNPIENDSKTPEEMKAFWEKAFTNMAEVAQDKMTYYICSPQGGDLLLLLLAINNSPLALKHTLVWNKNNHVLGRCDYNYKHEQILYGWKKKGTHTFYGQGEFKTTVWDVEKPLKNDLHPTMKPIRLVTSAILDGSKEGDIVLDVFGGSGSTLIAAEETGRKCYMMEIDTHYCDVIIARWEKLTGKQAKKIS
jgi:DNA modification methylase